MDNKTLRKLICGIVMSLFVAFFGAKITLAQTIQTQATPTQSTLTKEDYSKLLNDAITKVEKLKSLSQGSLLSDASINDAYDAKKAADDAVKLLNDSDKATFSKVIEDCKNKIDTANEEYTERAEQKYHRNCVQSVNAEIARYHQWTGCNPTPGQDITDEMLSTTRDNTVIKTPVKCDPGDIIKVDNKRVIFERYPTLQEGIKTETLTINFSKGDVSKDDTQTLYASPRYGG